MKLAKCQFFVAAACCVAFLTACETPQHPVSQPPPTSPAKKGPAQASPPASVNNWTTNWTPLFDGKTLNNWAVTDFGGHGDVAVSSGQINIAMGADLSGVNWTNGALPKTDYELSLQAMKIDGSDFFCGLTFPVGDSWCSLIIGGWGGGIVGLSSLDDFDASENETTTTMGFKNNQWYHVHMRVTSKRIQAWLDDEKIVDVSIVGRKVALRPGSIYLSEPLGVATYETTAAIRDFKLRLIEH